MRPLNSVTHKIRKPCSLIVVDLLHCAMDSAYVYIPVSITLPQRHSLKFYSRCTWSEMDFKTISHKSWIGEEGSSVQLRTLLLHVAQSLDIFSPP